MREGRTAPPRVLHVFESWRPVVSGYTTRSWELIRAQVEQRIAVPAVLVTSRQQVYLVEGKAPEIPDGLVGRFEVLPPSPGERLLRRVAPYHLDHRALGCALEAACRHHQPDLIHVHWSSGIGAAAAAAARRHRLPLVAEVRFDLAGTVSTERLAGSGLLERPLRRWFERHLEGAAAVVAASHSLADLLQGDGLAGEPAVVPNGVDAALFRPDHPDRALRRQLGLEARFVAGTTAKMLRYEGLDLLIRAAARARECGLDLALLLVGSGPEEAALRRAAAAAAVEVVFTGPVAPSEVPAHLRAMDLFCVPRRDASVTRHASPVKVLEAMACGVPVLASPLGDLPHLLAEGRGFTARPAEADLAAALGAVFDDRGARRRAAVEARRWVERHATWEASAGLHGQIYHRVLAERRR